MENSLLFKRIDLYASEIKKRRPLTSEEVKELDAYYRIGLTYSSNALEGNSLTLSETKVVIEDGLTVNGKPLRDCNEAAGHAKAYDFMLQLARGNDFSFSENDIKQLHHLFYNGIDSDKAGKYRGLQVFISGTEYVPPAAQDVPMLMEHFIEDVNARKNFLHPVELSAYVHRRLVDIHPFQDGNGRTARLLMNLILINKGYCIVSIPPILRHDYITALQQAQRADNPSDNAFIRLIAQCELEAQKDFFRMFHMRLPDMVYGAQERS